MRTHPVLRALVTLGATALALGIAGTASGGTYLVVYEGSALPADARATIEKAGGRVVAAYEQIGVVVAASTTTSFEARVTRDRRIEAAAPTDGFAARLTADIAVRGDAELTALPNAPASDEDETFWAAQWDMRQIQADKAHAITDGSPSVEVGIIDTGIDPDHPDLRSNLDFAKSASCESGAPVVDATGAAWDDWFGHGTHVAGTVAAADNSIGIAGVAPNVELVAVKASNDEGYFFPEAVVCSFIWAGLQRLDVTNSSYFVDPFLYTCRNDPLQRAIAKAVERAIRFATTQGVTVVAAAGNEADDLAHPRWDLVSPTFPPGSEVARSVTNACTQLPVEVPGVVGVSATGALGLKASYSNYGVGKIDVAAPGGDFLLQQTEEAPTGLVLSTLPAESLLTELLEAFGLVEEECAQGGSCAVYGYLEGTSMASPHAAGVAALIVSRYGDLRTPQNGKLRPGKVEAYLQATADSITCPTPAELELYDPFARPAPEGVDAEPQRCHGGPGYNAWYGHGQVNALKAVTHAAANR